MDELAQPAPRHGIAARSLALAIGVLGAAVYAVLSAGLMAPPDTTLFGSFIYNYYFLSILDGRLDVPLRVITLEGHYDAEGRAFLYHGLAPVITRALAWPFVDLRAVPLAAPSVWLFATLGSVTYHATALAILRRYGPGGGRPALLLGLGLGLAVWFAGPGLVLSANPTLYNEAIAVGFFCAAVWIAMGVRIALLGASPAAVMLVMAIAAGVTVHARVPTALGLYAGTCLMIVMYLWQTRGAKLSRPAAALVILFLFGAGFLAMNAMRFGDPLKVSGANTEGAAAITYGFVYWGVNPPGADQLDAFVREGTFNAKRIGPNLFLYLFDLPRTAVSDWMLELYRSWTVERGAIRVETPRFGMLWLWSPWFLIVLLGVLARRRGGPDRAAWTGVAPLLAGTAIVTALMLAYGTLAFRYRIDLWPLLGASALLALAPLCATLRDGSSGGRGSVRPDLALLGGALCVSMVLSLATAVSYSRKSSETGIFSFWDAETCARMVLEKGFAEADVPRLCSL